MSSEESRFTKEFEKIFGGKFDKNKKYIIVVQGNSCSGKTTAVSNWMKCLKKIDSNDAFLNLDVFHVDNYYRHTGNMDPNVDYDFDNPGAIGWESARNSFIQMAQKHSLIIAEGIYAFNLVNEMVFDEDKYDIRDMVFKKNHFKKNPLYLSLKKFKILRVLFTTSNDHMTKVRIERDLVLRGEDETITRHFIGKYVLNGIKNFGKPISVTKDIEIEGGNFNEEAVESFLLAMKQYFLLE